MLTEFQNKFRAGMTVKEHPYFHPERTLYNHMLLVTLKAYFLWLNGYPVELVWAALFHDICKPDHIDRTVNYSKIHDGVLVEGTYDSNFHHAQQGADYWSKFYDSFDWSTWRGLGYTVPDKELVYLLVKHHMDKFKQGESVEVDYMFLFNWCDDMIGRNPTPSIQLHWEHSFPYFEKVGYTGWIHNIGMSPIQRNFSYSGGDQNLLEFSVVISKTPETFYFSKLPNMFRGTWVKEILG